MVSGMAGLIVSVVVFVIIRCDYQHACIGF